MKKYRPLFPRLIAFRFRLYPEGCMMGVASLSFKARATVSAKMTAERFNELMQEQAQHVIAHRAKTLSPRGGAKTKANADFDHAELDVAIRAKFADGKKPTDRDIEGWMEKHSTSRRTVQRRIAKVRTEKL